MVLVGVEAESQIRTMVPPEPRLWQSAYKVKTTNSDASSLGYDSMTTLSEPVSLIKQ